MANSRCRPPIYYGWVISVALAITQMTSWGVLYYAFSVILKPLHEELKWDQGIITGGFSLAILVSGIAAVPIGRCLDHYGARLIMTLGSCVGVILVLAWSQVTTPLSFYAVWFLMGFAMSAILYEPAFTVVANWFTYGRAKALTILTLGGGLSSVIYVPLTEWLVSQYGWRLALMILAGMLALATIPLHALIVRRRPMNIGVLTNGSASAMSPWSRSIPEPCVSAQTAVREAAFWWLTAAFSLSAFVFIAITVHLIPYLTERGFSAAFAAAVLGLLGGSQIPGRLLLAPLDSRLPRRLLMVALFGMQMLAVFVLITTPAEAGILVFAILFGASAGASSPARAVVLADIYGSAHYGSINGIQAFVMTLARSIAPVGIGILCGAIHTYRPVPWLLAAMAIAALGATLKATHHGPHQEAVIR